MATRDPSYVPLRVVAARLGVPKQWLRDEAVAGRIPAVRAGRRWLAKLHEVETIIDARAKENATGTTSAGGAA